MTVAHEIKSPFFRRCRLPDGKIGKFYFTLVTIWHCDPERNGDDDSCGWGSPRLTDEQKKEIERMVEWDMDFPYFSAYYHVGSGIILDPKYSYTQQPAGECLAMVAEAWRLIAWYFDKRQANSCAEWWNVVGLACVRDDNIRSILSDHDEDATSRVRCFLYCVARAYLRHHRPWYRHPRWHIHHWKIQVHPWQRLRRYLFSRCEGCGERFKYGYSPTTGWGNEWPRRWWKSIKGEYHSECYDREVVKHEYQQT